MKIRVLFLLMILMTVHNSYCMKKENSESRKGMSQSGMFTFGDDNKDKTRSIAWYAPTAFAAGCLLENVISFKTIPTCIAAGIGIGAGVAGQWYLNKSYQQEKEIITGTDQSKEVKRNYRIGAAFKSVGWIGSVVACNGIINYIMKKPLVFHGLQAFDRLIITPGFFNKAPEFAQLCQDSHLAAVGIALLGVGAVSNYFLKSPSEKLNRL